MKAFDRRNLALLHADIVGALKAVEKQHGITITVSMGRFSPSEYRTKLTAATPPDVGTVDTTGLTTEQVREKGRALLAKQEFELYSRSFGVKPEAFGTTFTYAGKRFTVCGIKPRSPKFPILAINERGKTFKFPASALGGLAWAQGPGGFENRHED